MTEDKTTQPQKKLKKKLLIVLLVILIGILISYFAYTSYPKYYKTLSAQFFNATDIKDPIHNQDVTVAFSNVETGKRIKWKKVEISVFNNISCINGNCDAYSKFFSGRTNGEGEIELNISEWNAINTLSKSDIPHSLKFTINGYQEKKIRPISSNKSTDYEYIGRDTTEIELKFSK